MNRTYGILCQHLVDQGVPEAVAITATMYFFTHNLLHRSGWDKRLIKELVSVMLLENDFDWFRWDHTPEGYEFWAQVEETYIMSAPACWQMGH